MKKKALFLILIFVITLGFNLVYTLEAQEFTGDSAYNSLRQIESIMDTGAPLYEDDLSFNGREHILAPLFFYIIALFAKVMPLYIAAKIIPAIFTSSIVFVVYLIARKISNREDVALVSAFISGFIPAFTSLTLNTVSPFSLAIPLMFLSFYFFLNVDQDEKSVIYFIITFLVSLLTHPITLLLIFVLLIYLAIANIEGGDASNIEKEIIIFSTFFIMWAYFIMYKEVLLTYGPEIIWGSLPSSIRAEYFSNFSILEGIVNVGLIPFLLGIYTTYKMFFKEKSKKNYLYISMVLSSFLLLWMNFIGIKIGLSILGLTLVLLYAHFHDSFLTYIKKTKFHMHMNKIVIGLLLIFIMTSVIPSIVEANANVKGAFQEDEIAAMNWLNENTEYGSVILASPHEGGIISFVAGRKNIADTDFMLVENPEETLEDIETIYTTRFETEAIPLLTRYDIDYILLTNKMLRYYNIDTVRYIENEKCFELVYNDRARIYRPKCWMKVMQIEN